MNFKFGKKSLNVILIYYLFFHMIPLSTFAQKSSWSVKDIEEKWKRYTTFQKKELLSFCDFLFEEGYYKRATLAYFRYLFLYPSDELIPAIYYKIALSYEYLDNYSLALNYYQEVQKQAPPNSSEYISAGYRIVYLHLLQGDYLSVYSLTEGSTDPYHLVFRGYALVNELQWEEAKGTFLKARTAFKTKKYNRILGRLMRACDAASALPTRNKTVTALLSIVPGGGRAYHRDWIPAAGTWMSTLGLILQATTGSPQFISKSIPLFSLVGISGLSIIGSLHDVELSNRKVKEKYARRIMRRLRVENFLDFTEPGYLSIE